MTRHVHIFRLISKMVVRVKSIIYFDNMNEGILLSIDCCACACMTGLVDGWIH